MYVSTFICPHATAGYNRSQSSSVSPRGYGSNGSTPHSVNGGAYGTAPAMNGYHSGPGPLGNMGEFRVLVPTRNIPVKS